MLATDAIPQAAAYTPEAFYVDYAYNVPTDILISHPRAIVHPNAIVDLAAAKAAGTTVYGYISVGELGPNAPHRATALAAGLPLRGKNPIWNSDLTDLRDGRWATFIVETLARGAVNKGYSGFFLDTLDSIEIAGTAAEIAAQRTALIALINKLHATFPNQRIIVNRGFETVPSIRTQIEGLLVESVYSAYDFTAMRYIPAVASDTAALVAIMQREVAAGLEVFVLDYKDPADPAAALAAANYILSQGYHAFVSTPDLDGVVLGPWQPVAPAIQSAPRALRVRPGAAAELRVRALGDPLPSYTWYRNGVVVPGATEPVLRWPAVSAAEAGSYTVKVENRQGAVTSAPAVLTVDAAATEGRLLNLSSRARVGTGGAQLIPGVVTRGAVRVLARAVGPTLATFGVANVLSDPRLTVVSGGVEVAANDRWQDTAGAAVAAAGVAAGAFALPAGSADAALLWDANGGLTLPVGGHGGTGNALVEVYAIPASGATGSLINLATRADVRTGDEVLVMGFVLGGDAASTVLIRAVGPGLAAYGVSGLLADPEIEVRVDGELLGDNDDWGAEADEAARVAAATARLGTFALAAGSADAALVLTLPPGAYTATVRGKDATTGVALAEIYLVP